MHRARSLAGALPLLVAGMVTPALGGPWSEAERDEGVVVETRAEPNSDVDRVRGRVILTYTTDQVAAVLTDVAHHHTFMPKMERADVLERSVRPDGRVVQLIHQLTALPVINNRDVVLHTETWSEQTPDGRVWHSTFHALRDAGPPLQDGWVRITRLSGAWTLSPIANGQGTAFSYECHAEVGGNVPDFMAESGQVGTVIEMLKGLRARCRAVYRGGARAQTPSQ